MRVVVVSPTERRVYETKISGSLASIQELVGGGIEGIYLRGIPGYENHMGYIHGEGRLMDLPKWCFRSKAMGDMDFNGTMVIFGPPDDEGADTPATGKVGYLQLLVQFLNPPGI